MLPGLKDKGKTAVARMTAACSGPLDGHPLRQEDFIQKSLNCQAGDISDGDKCQQQ